MRSIRATVTDTTSRLVAHPWAAAAALLPAGLALLIYVLAPMDFQACHASTDDTFYYYAWAWNLANGLGPTADGVTPTNGVQPLWAGLLTVLAFFVDDRATFVRGALLLCLVCNLAAGAIWCRVAHRLGGPWFAWCTGLLTTLVFVKQQWVVLTGMEISLNLLLIALLVLVFLVLRERGWHHERLEPLALGLLVALFLLGRIDNVLHLAPLVVLDVGLRVAGRTGIFPFVRVRDLPWLAAPILVLLVPYYLWNLLEFGSVLPVSGRIKIWNAAREFRNLGMESIGDRLVYALARGWRYAFLPLRWIIKDLGLEKFWMALGAFGPLVVMAIAVALSNRRQVKRVGTAIALGVLVVLPRTTIHALRLRDADLFYANWYRAAALLSALLVVSWIISRMVLLFSLRRWTATAVLVFALAAINPGYKMVRYQLLHSPSREVEAWRLPMAKVAAVRWAEANLPADAVVGSFNSGIMHWYGTRPVLNLDGRVDDGSLGEVRLEGLGYREYMRRRGVTHLIDTWVESSFWQALGRNGRILHRVPYGPQHEKEIVVLQLERDEVDR